MIEHHATASQASFDALVTQGFTVKSEENTRQELDRRPQAAALTSCRRPECASRLARLLGVELAVQVKVWTTEDIIPQRVVVTLQPQQGPGVEGEARVPSGVLTDMLRDAAKTATLKAIQQYRLGHPSGEGSTASGSSNLNWIGPLVLGVAGLAGIGVVGVALITKDENEELNPLPAILYGGLGAGAIGGAIVWFSLSSSSESRPGVQAGIGPLGASVRGRF